MESKQNIESAILASGCFWGTEYHLQKVDGVIETTCGYIGGDVESPTYEQVKTGSTGHAEAVLVTFDSEIVSYEEILKIFFETHDSGQIGGQGPDIGDQYRSEIFLTNDGQKEVALDIIDQLRTKGYEVVTKLTEASIFYSAEDYHQDYYDTKGSSPYCHIYTKKF